MRHTSKIVYIMASGTPALVALNNAGVQYVIREYDHDPTNTAFGLEAAEKLNVDAERVFKTLVANVDDEYVVAIVPVTCTVNLKSLARAVGGKKAAMADPAIAQRLTGYVVGGISPLGQKKQLRTAIDETCELWDTVLVSGGKRGLDVELAPADLIAMTHAVVDAIAEN